MSDRIQEGQINQSRGLRCLGFAVILIIVQPGLLSAQDHPNRATIDVSFDFDISSGKLTAGPYSLDLIAPTYVMLRSQDGKVRQKLYFIQTAVAGKNSTAPCTRALVKC